MKKIMILIGLVFMLSGCSKEEVIEPVEKVITTFETCRVEMYDMDLKLDVNQHRLSGKVEMKIINETKDSLNELCIRNYADTYLKEFGLGETKIENVKTNDGLSLTTVFKEDASVVYVTLNEALEPDETMTLTLDYYTDIPNYASRFSYYKNDKGNLYQLSFCFPTLSMYKDGKWNENPVITLSGESNFQKMTNYNVTLEVPDSYLVASVGNETKEGNIWKIEANNVREMAIVASDYMQAETVKTDLGVDINNYYLESENNTNYRYYQLNAAKDAMELFSTLVGEYPYTEIDVMQTAISGGMEFPGLVMIGFDTRDENLDETTQFAGLCRIVAHEVGHQWFYCSVCSDPYKEAWLDEGLTSYLEETYMRSGLPSIREATLADVKRDFSVRISGLSEAEYQEYVKQEMDLFFSEGSIINKAYDEFGDGFTFQESYSTMVYSGGKYFLMELEDAMGREDFYMMLQDYYKSYYLKEATTQDFINILRHHDNSSKILTLISKYIQ